MKVFGSFFEMKTIVKVSAFLLASIFICCTSSVEKSGSFPFTKQETLMDCGPACMKMICDFHELNITKEKLYKKFKITDEGVSLLELSDVAEKIGFRTLSARVDLQKVRDEAPLPCIAHWNNSHFIVVYEITNDSVRIADPADTLRTLSYNDFLNGWMASDSATINSKGVVMLLEKKKTN